MEAATNLTGTYYISSAILGTYLTVTDTNPGTNLTTFQYSGAPEQQWVLAPGTGSVASSTVYAVKNVKYQTYVSYTATNNPDNFVGQSSSPLNWFVDVANGTQDSQNISLYLHIFLIAHSRFAPDPAFASPWYIGSANNSNPVIVYGPCCGDYNWWRLWFVSETSASIGTVSPSSALTTNSATASSQTGSSGSSGSSSNNTALIVGLSVGIPLCIVVVFMGCENASGVRREMMISNALSSPVRLGRLRQSRLIINFGTHGGLGDLQLKKGNASPALALRENLGPSLVVRLHRHGIKANRPSRRALGPFPLTSASLLSGGDTACDDIKRVGSLVQPSKRTGNGRVMIDTPRRKLSTSQWKEVYTLTARDDTGLVNLRGDWHRSTFQTQRLMFLLLPLSALVDSFGGGVPKSSRKCQPDFASYCQLQGIATRTACPDAGAGLLSAIRETLRRTGKVIWNAPHDAIRFWARVVDLCTFKELVEGAEAEGEVVRVHVYIRNALLTQYMAQREMRTNSTTYCQASIR
ncbi:hypothetical protein BU15DRAFT_67266 [Melanogaster broomeanus]|nr:hypothetical protein BU15DRAFT_67266 [Melanogaster broomeanus]